VIRRRIAVTGLTLLLAGGAALVNAVGSDAASTVQSALTLAGPVTAPCPTAAPTITAPAGSTVRFSTSLLGATTAPISNLLLAPAVRIVLNPGTASQSSKVISYAAGAPRVVDVPVPAAGSIPFSYTTGTANAKSGGLLGGTLALLGQLGSSFTPTTGISLSTSAKWSGRIVVGTPSSSGCTLQAQLPSVGVTVSAPAVKLPPVTVPGVTLPPVSLPPVSLPPISLPAVSLPAPSTLPLVGGLVSGLSSAANGLTGLSPSVPALGPSPSAAPSVEPAASSGRTAGSAAEAGKTSAAESGSPSAGTLPGAGVSGGSRPPSTARPASPSIELAVSRDRAALDTVPALLVVLAVAALSAATAMYGRTFLLERAQRMLSDSPAN
jgi:hypothetical protein